MSIIAAMRCPFSIQFASDNYEFAANGDATGGSITPQRSAKVGAPGLVKFVPAVAYIPRLP